MERKSKCNCKCHTLTSEEMVKPVPIQDLCDCKCESHKSPEPNDGTFIEHKNTSFSSEGTVRYGEEADADDL